MGYDDVEAGQQKLNSEITMVRGDKVNEFVALIFSKEDYDEIVQIVRSEQEFTINLQRLNDLVRKSINRNEGSYEG